MEFVIEIVIDISKWFFLTFLQGLFNFLLPTDDPRLIRLQRLGAALLFLGVAGVLASPFVGIFFGLASGGLTFGAGIFTILVAGAIGGRIEDGVRESRHHQTHVS